MPPGALYLAAVVAVILGAVYLPESGLSRPLLSPANALWLFPLLLLPVLLGWALQHYPRRLLAWPYAYLVALLLALRGAAGSDVDQAYAYAGECVLLAAIVLAELLGLSLGRWLHRAAAAAFFAAAALWQFIEAWRSYAAGAGGSWHAATLACGALLFCVQAALQYRRYREQLAEELQPQLPPGGLPEGPAWVIRVDADPAAGAEAAVKPIPPAPGNTAGMLNSDHPAAGLAARPDPAARDEGGAK